MTGRLGRFVLPAALTLATAIAITLPGCGGGKSTGPLGGPVATVTGAVQDAVSGAPVAGATVRASSGAAATTDPSGRFSVNVAAGQRVRVDVTKEGFSLNQLVVELASGQSRAFVVGLIAEGSTAAVNVASGGAVTDLGSKAVLTLPAGFVTAAGSVDVTVTGLDPTTAQIKALPGGLDALDANGAPVYLSPVSFAEYTVRDAAGNILPFNPAASQGADIELPIPAALQGRPGYGMGDPIECYVYDPADGKWKTPVPGVIGPSSVDGSPAIKATIFHLSWYGGAPASSDVACVEGYVRLNGVPVANVDVEAFAGGNARTDANGFYRVQAAPNSVVRVVASQAAGSSFRLAEGVVTTGGPGAPCARLDLSLGELQPGEYLVTAYLLSDTQGTAAALAHIAIVLGAKEVDVTGATVQIGSGGTWHTLTNFGSGNYGIVAGTGTFDLVAGTLYTMRFDHASDGTWDAQGTVRMSAIPAITSPTPSAVVAPSFVATWTDPGIGLPGYDAHYFGAIESDSSFDTAFITEDVSYEVGTGVPQPGWGFPNDPLVPGGHRITVWAVHGSFFYWFEDSLAVPNVTGENTTGHLASLGVGDQVAFTVAAAGRAPRTPALATRPRTAGLELPAWATDLLRRMDSRARLEKAMRAASRR